MDQGRKKHPSVKAALVVAVIVVVALLLLTPAVQSFLRDLISSPFQPRYPESATFSLQRTLTVKANGGEVLNYTLDISEPENISQNGYTIQQVDGVTYAPAVSESMVRYGQDWVVWKGTSFSGEQVRTYTATYQVTAYTHIWSIDKDKSLNVSDIPASLKAQYNHDEWKIDVTSPSIVATSKAIVGDETNVYLILKDIYDWMTSNIRYPSVAERGEPQSALETLQSRVGDCDDQSILFASLARVAGVPAWLQIGALYVDAENTWGGHGWLQAYIPLKSGGGEQVTIDLVNKDFLVFRPNRFVDFTDDGQGSHLSDYYYTFITSYDPSTYPAGKVPSYSDGYVKLSYEESSKKISQGGAYTLDPSLMLVGTVRAQPRR